MSENEQQQEQGGLSLTPQQQEFNKDVMLNHVRFTSLEDYLAEAQRRGAIPFNLTEEQRAHIAGTFEAAKQS